MERSHDVMRAKELTLREVATKNALLLLAIAGVVALALSACQNASGDPEKYRRDHDRYIGSHEPKTGRPDL